MQGSNTVTILYNQEGQPADFTVNGAQYSYVKDLQGDVLYILDGLRQKVVSYSYDPWGVPTITGNTALAAYNPCSYRGYYYDFETGFYYLQSRYYDPELGRFLNADEPVFLGMGGTLQSYSLFVYCYNNPVFYFDSTGYAVETVFDIGSALWSLLDLITVPSWLNLGFFIWDIVSILIPFVPGSYIARGGKLAIKVASVASDFARGSEFLTGTYKQLKKLFKGKKGIEIHHIIEKRFKTLFKKGLSTDDFLSIPLTKELHREITNRWRRALGYGIDYSKLEIWEMYNAIVYVYRDMPELLEIALDWLYKNWKY